MNDTLAIFVGNALVALLVLAAIVLLVAVLVVLLERLVLAGKNLYWQRFRGPLWNVEQVLRSDRHDDTKLDLIRSYVHRSARKWSAVPRDVDPFEMADHPHLASR